MGRKRLTTEERNLALRRIGEGYSRKEVAASMGVTPRAITGNTPAERQRKSRTVKARAKKVGRRGTTPPGISRRTK
jgi:hypothetical protein